MAMFSRALAGALVLLAAAPAVAQDETQTFNAFAVVLANGSVVRAGEKQLVVAGSLAGPMFIETGEGPQQAGRVLGRHWPRRGRHPVRRQRRQLAGLVRPRAQLQQRRRRPRRVRVTQRRRKLVAADKALAGGPSVAQAQQHGALSGFATPAALACVRGRKGDAGQPTGGQRVDYRLT